MSVYVTPPKPKPYLVLWENRRVEGCPFSMFIYYGIIEKPHILAPQLITHWAGCNIGPYLLHPKKPKKMTQMASYLQNSHQSRSWAEGKPPPRIIYSTFWAPNLFVTPCLLACRPDFWSFLGPKIDFLRTKMQNGTPSSKKSHGNPPRTNLKLFIYV